MHWRIVERCNSGPRNTCLPSLYCCSTFRALFPARFRFEAEDMQICVDGPRYILPGTPLCLRVVISFYRANVYLRTGNLWRSTRLLNSFRSFAKMLQGVTTTASVVQTITRNLQSNSHAKKKLLNGEIDAVILHSLLGMTCYTHKYTRKTKANQINVSVAFLNIFSILRNRIVFWKGSNTNTINSNFLLLKSCLTYCGNFTFFM